MKRYTFACLVAIFVTTLVLAQNIADLSKLPPQYKDAVLRINNWEYGHRDNCFVHLAEHPKGTFIWGRKGAVSEVAYTYLGQDGKSDIYRLTRKYPLGEADMKTNEITISYKGQEIMLWRKAGGKQIFIISPAVATQP